jgi:hypothetical protein
VEKNRGSVTLDDTAVQGAAASVNRSDMSASVSISHFVRRLMMGLGNTLKFIIIESRLLF